MSLSVHRRAGALAAGAAAFAGSACAMPAGLPEDHGHLRRRLDSSDVEALVGLYSPKGVFMREEMKAVVGHDALRAAYKEVFATLKVNLQFTMQEAEESGDMGWRARSPRARSSC